MSELKPNHICKNSKCKCHYYACDYCGKTQNWRSMACSTECYEEYVQQVIIARSKNIPVDTYPERTDMTHDEIVEMVINTPLEDVKEKTMMELSDYSEDIKTGGIAKTVDKINTDLKRNSSEKKRK